MKYNVSFKVETTIEMDIKANTEEEAIEKAKETFYCAADDGDFYYINYDGWSIYGEWASEAYEDEDYEDEDYEDEDEE